MPESSRDARWQPRSCTYEDPQLRTGTGKSPFEPVFYSLLPSPTPILTTVETPKVTAVVSFPLATGAQIKTPVRSSGKGVGGE